MAQPLLDDALWARLEPLLPKPRRRGRRRGGRPRRRPDVLQGDRGYDRNRIGITSPFALNATTASITPSSRWGAR